MGESKWLREYVRYKKNAAHFLLLSATCTPRFILISGVQKIKTFEKTHNELQEKSRGELADRRKWRHERK